MNSHFPSAKQTTIHFFESTFGVKLNPPYLGSCPFHQSDSLHTLHIDGSGNFRCFHCGIQGDHEKAKQLAKAKTVYVVETDSNHPIFQKKEEGLFAVSFERKNSAQILRLCVGLASNFGKQIILCPKPTPKSSLFYDAVEFEFDRQSLEDLLTPDFSFVENLEGGW